MQRVCFVLIMTPRLIANSPLYNINVYTPFLSFTSHAEPGHMLPFSFSAASTVPTTPSPLRSLTSCVDAGGRVQVWPGAKLWHTTLCWPYGSPTPLRYTRARAHTHLHSSTHVSLHADVSEWDKRDMLGKGCGAKEVIFRAPKGPLVTRFGVYLKEWRNDNRKRKRFFVFISTMGMFLGVFLFCFFYVLLTCGLCELLTMIPGYLNIQMNKSLIEFHQNTPDLWHKWLKTHKLFKNRIESILDYVFIISAVAFLNLLKKVGLFKVVVGHMLLITCSSL